MQLRSVLAQVVELEEGGDRLVRFAAVLRPRRFDPARGVGLSGPSHVRPACKLAAPPSRGTRVGGRVIVHQPGVATRVLVAVLLAKAGVRVRGPGRVREHSAVGYSVSP